MKRFTRIQKLTETAYKKIFQTNVKYLMEKKGLNLRQLSILCSEYEGVKFQDSYRRKIGRLLSIRETTEGKRKRITLFDVQMLSYVFGLKDISSLLNENQILLIQSTCLNHQQPKKDSTMKRFTRIQTLTEEEQRELKQVVDTTRGYSLFGNRARVALMLPPETAKFISEQSKKKEKSPSEIINEIITTYIEIITGE